MVNQQLLEYVKQQLQLGFNKDQITASLKALGWPDAGINETFDAIFNPTMAYQPQPTMPSITSLPSASAIFADAKSLYTQRMATFLGIMALPMLVMTGLIIMLKNAGIVEQASMPSTSMFTAGRPVLSIISLVAILLITGLSHIFGQVALLCAIKDSGEGIGVMESYRRGSKKILSFIWVSILVGVITVGGYFLFLVPGIIFSVWFSFATIIFVVEGLRGMDALLKSKEYAKGQFGKIFGYLFFIGVVSVVISIVLSIASAVFSKLLPIPFVKDIIKAIFGLFLTPLVLSYLFLVYTNLRAVKGNISFAPSQGKKTGLLVVGIIALLTIPAYLILPNLALNSAREKARDSKRLADLKQIQTALELYYSDKDSYPTHPQPIKLGTTNYSCLNSVNAFTTTRCKNPHMFIVPTDPSEGQFYEYTSTNGTTYTITARLEGKVGNLTDNILATPQGIK